jgi:SNF family Na+-dependent transporter
MRKFTRRTILALIGFAVGWLVCFVEAACCYSAYGGPFTVLMLFLMLFVFAGLAVGISLLAGLLLRIPGVRDLWRGVEDWSLLLSAAAVAVMVFASKLGLRTVDPVSNYRMMPFGIWVVCLLGIVFPIVNLPSRHERDA